MLYSVVLFVHVLATVVLTSSLTVEAVALGRMRRARTVSEAKLWMDPVPALPIVVGASVLVLLISGGYLAAKMMAWSLGWPKVALGSMFLIAPLGAATGRRMQAIRRTLQDQAHGASVIEPMNDRFLRLSLNIRSWILAGIILLMTAKPDLRPSLIIIAVCTGLGILATLVGGRRHTGFQRTDAKAPTTSA